VARRLPESLVGACIRSRCRTRLLAHLARGICRGRRTSIIAEGELHGEEALYRSAASIQHTGRCSSGLIEIPVQILCSRRDLVAP
jgi:hypothetical protein